MDQGLKEASACNKCVVQAKLASDVLLSRETGDRTETKIVKVKVKNRRRMQSVCHNYLLWW